MDSMVEFIGDVVTSLTFMGSLITVFTIVLLQVTGGA